MEKTLKDIDEAGDRLGAMAVKLAELAGRLPEAEAQIVTAIENEADALADVLTSAYLELARFAAVKRHSVDP